MIKNNCSSSEEYLHTNLPWQQEECSWQDKQGEVILCVRACVGEREIWGFTVKIGLEN